MIRTIIIPNTTSYNLSFDFPEDYLGEEIEIIAFKKYEGFVKNSAKPTMKDFWGIISDETAEKLNQEVETSRMGAILI